jgi:hypothetical protein
VDPLATISKGGTLHSPLSIVARKKKKKKQNKRRRVNPLATISMVITMKVTMNVVGNDKGGWPVFFVLKKQDGPNK